MKNNRERQAEFKQRMRDAGKKQITVWVTSAQEKIIRTLLAEEGKLLTNSPRAIPECAPGESDDENQD